MFLVPLGFVCLFVSKYYSKISERIAMKFYGGGQGGKRNNYLNVRGDLGLVRKVNDQKNNNRCSTSDRGAGYKQVVAINLEYL